MYLLLAVFDGGSNELGVFGLLGSRKDQGWVGGGILRLVLANGYDELSVNCPAVPLNPSPLGLFRDRGDDEERNHILAKSPESHTTT
jgi:hypothetical protein